MLVDPQDLRAGPTGQLRDALFDEMMIPALDGCAADRMGARQLALADASVVTVEDLKTVRLRRAIARTDARKAMTEIAAATGTMIFGHRKVHDQDLVALTRVLELALISRLDPQPPVAAIKANRPLRWPRPHTNVASPLDTDNLNIRQP